MFIPLNHDETLHRQIYTFIRAAILSGRLPSGTRLPSTRGWAAQLGVSRTVLLLAFDQLMAEGYIRGVPGSGTVVCDGIPDGFAVSQPEVSVPAQAARPVLSDCAERLMSGEASQPAGPRLIRGTHLYDFHYGNREAVDFPHKVWQRIAARRMAHALPTRSPTAGYPPLREVVAGHLQRTRGVRCTADQLVIVNGSQQALDLVARLLLNPDHGVVIEEPHYHGARQAFHAAGARLIPCRVDSEGLVVQDLPRDGGCSRLAYVTPSHQFPTGAVLPLPRRLALIEWAERNNAFIVEDDYDGELRYDCRPIEAVQSLDRSGRVIYVGTFSKALSPELRLGYVVVPETILSAFLTLKWVSDLFAPTPVQEVLTDFMREGHYDRHLRRLRERNAGRRQALLDATQAYLGDEAIIAGVKAGMHAVVWLPRVPLSRLPDVVEQAERRGVLVYPVSNYYLGRPSESGVLLSFASLGEDEIREGIRRFAESLALVEKEGLDRSNGSDRMRADTVGELHESL